MAQYMQFTSQDGSKVLIEMHDDDDGVITRGNVKATGLGAIGEKAVTTAETIFEKAVGDAVGVNVHALLQAVRNLPVLDQPESMEVAFALKASAQFGNLVIATGTAEANYTVTFSWKRNSQ